jgi:protein TonB
MTTVGQKSQPDRPIHSSPLWIYFLASVLIHGLAALVIILSERSQPTAKQQQDYTPIDFVVVPPEEKPNQPKPKTQRRAVNNSIAQGKIKSKQPPATAKKGSAASDSKDSKSAVANLPKVAPSPQQAKKSSVATPAKPTPPIAAKPRAVKSPQSPSQPPTVSARSPLRSSETLKSNQRPSDRQEQTPKKTMPESAKSAISSQNSPVSPKPAQKYVARKAPSNSSAASLLGGKYQRSSQQDSGSSFFKAESLASKEGPYAKLDAQQDDLAPYFAHIRRRVKKNWQPTSPNSEQNTVLNFAIQRNGQITELRVVESSGDEQVDRDALAAVQKSSPFKALPQTFPRDLLEVQFSFNIYIHQGLFSPNSRLMP